MPTYQYVCTECGGHLEVVQKFTDDALTVHEECGGRLRKVFSPVGIVFKGSGFYRNDSRSGGSAGKPGSEKTGSEKPGSEKSGAGSSSSSADSAAKSSGEKSGSGSPSSPSSPAGSSSSSPGKSSGEKVA